jgi:hypothetical protein
LEEAVSYSTDPVADQAAHYDALDAEIATLAAERAAVAAEIKQTLLAGIRVLPIAALAIPCVDGGNNGLSVMPATEAVLDALDNDETQAFLFRALCKSNCPEVEALRNSLAARVVHLHADEVAAYRTGIF